MRSYEFTDVNYEVLAGVPMVGLTLKVTRKQRNNKGDISLPWCTTTLYTLLEGAHNSSIKKSKMRETKTIERNKIDSYATQCTMPVFSLRIHPSNRAESAFLKTENRSRDTIDHDVNVKFSLRL
jgi:hypothetical protein